MIKIDNVTKRYGKLVALDHVSLDVQKGTHLLILGPNGAGKTTLIKCILNLASFDGRIMVNGFDAKRESTGVKRMVGYVPQNYAFYDNLSIQEHARMSSRLKRVNAIQARENLEMVDLWRVRNRKIRTLSDGMRQRLGIALALIGGAPILILDEPTSNIDLRGQIEFQDLLLRLLREGKTIITTTHLTGLGELASEVLVLDKGKRIAYGKPSALLGRVNVADTLYLRVDSSRENEISALIRSEVDSQVVAKGNWLTASIPSNSKMNVLRSLLGSGIKIDDLIIERSSIESEYLRLLGDGEAA